MASKESCHICGKELLKDSIPNHLFSVHGVPKDEIKILRNDARLAKYAGVELKCFECGLKFASIDGLKRHSIRVHDIELKKECSTPCAVLSCEKTFASSFEMSRHAQLVHSEYLSGDAGYQEEWFLNEEKAKEFLTALMENSGTQLNIQTRCKLGNDTSKTYYICSRQNDESAPEFKRVGYTSKKCAPLCTARAEIVVQKDGKALLRVTTGHFGHAVDAALIKLTHIQEQLIVEKLKEGIDADNIISQMQSKWPEENRLFWLTTKDIRHIKSKYLRSSERKDRDDLRSVLKRFEEGVLEDGIHMCAVSESNEDIRIVVLTPAQIDVLNKHGHRGVVLDDTFSVTSYTLRLTTMIAIDDEGRGVPSGYLISGNVSTEDVTYLFKVVRELIPTFRPRYIMGDDSSVFYNGYCKVFPENITYTERLLCRWHLLQTWNRRQKSRGPDEQMLVREEKHRKLFKNIFKKLVRIPDPDRFRNYFVSVLDLISSTGYPAFAEYLSKNYGGRLHEWTSIGRENAPFKTSMHSESFHSYLKMKLLCKKRAVRLDVLIDILIRCPNDVLQRQRVHDRRQYVTVRQMENHRKHVFAMNNFEGHVTKIPLHDDRWTVTRNNTSTACVKVAANCHCKAIPRCRACTGSGCPCPCRFTCTCLQQVAGISCSHIHAVAIHLKGADLPVVYETVEETVVDTPTLVLQAAPSPLDLPSHEPPPQDYALDTDDDRKRSTFQAFATSIGRVEAAMKKLLKDPHADMELMREAEQRATSLAEYLEQRTNANTTPLVPRRKMQEGVSNNNKSSLRDPSPSPVFANTLNTSTERKTASIAVIATGYQLQKRKRRNAGEEAALETMTVKIRSVFCASCYREVPHNHEEDIIDWVECNACKQWHHKTCVNDVFPCGHSINK